MATFSSKEIVAEILENNGAYPGDPQCARMYSYDGVLGGEKLFAMFMAEEHDDMMLSPYVKNPVLLFTAEEGLTSAGKAFLMEQSGEKEEEQYEYLVRWEVYVDARNPVEAAKIARKMQLDPGSEAVFFEVMMESSCTVTTSVDLLYEQEKENEDD